MTEHGKPEVGTEHWPNQLGITQADDGRAVDRDRSKGAAVATVQIRERPYPEIGDELQHPTKRSSRWQQPDTQNKIYRITTGQRRQGQRRRRRTTIPNMGILDLGGSTQLIPRKGSQR